MTTNSNVSKLATTTFPYPKDLVLSSITNSSLNIRAVNVNSAYYETFFSMCVFPCSLALSLLLYLKMPSLSTRRRYFIDHCLYSIPMIITMTEFPFINYHWFVTLYIVTTYIATILHLRLGFSDLGYQKTQPLFNSSLNRLSPMVDSRGRVTCLNIFRGCVYVATNNAILARDLPAFHKVFAKTYNFGTGLMDVGLGCFVFAMGNMGVTARSTRQPAILSTVRSALRDSLILTIFGLIRLALTSMQVAGASPFEYGKHWNVFFSLAVVKFVGTCGELVLPKKCPPILAGLVIGLIYEYALYLFLAEYIIQPNVKDQFTRLSGIFAANREGMCALVGLFGLYFWGVHFGRWVTEAKIKQTEKGFRQLLGKFFVLFFICAIPINIIRYFDSKPIHIFMESRRMGNLAYTLWIVSYGSFMTGCFLLIQYFFAKRKYVFSQYLKANFEGYLFDIDRFGLVYFILGNLATGAINLTLLRQNFAAINKNHIFTFTVLNIYLYLLPLVAKGITNYIKL